MLFRKLITTSFFIVFFGGAAFAQEKPPWCSNSGKTIVENTICANLNLARLDIEMVAAFVKARKAGNDVVNFQKDWLKWRDACGGNVACLERRYYGRLADLGQGRYAQGSSGDVVSKRFVRGGFETTYSDGKTVWKNRGRQVTTFANGVKEERAFVTQNATSPYARIPALPEGSQRWAKGAEARILHSLSIAMGQNGLDEYLRDYVRGGFYERMDEHLKAVNYFLSQE